MEAIKKIQLRVKNEYPETKVLTPLKIAEKRTIIYELDRHLKKMTSVLNQHLFNFFLLERKPLHNTKHYRDLFISSLI